MKCTISIIQLWFGEWSMCPLRENYFDKRKTSLYFPRLNHAKHYNNQWIYFLEPSNDSWKRVVHNHRRNGNTQWSFLLQKYFIFTFFINILGNIFTIEVVFSKFSTSRVYLKAKWGFPYSQLNNRNNFIASVTVWSKEWPKGVCISSSKYWGKIWIPTVFYISWLRVFFKGGIHIILISLVYSLELIDCSFVKSVSYSL